MPSISRLMSSASDGIVVDNVTDDDIHNDEAADNVENKQGEDDNGDNGDARDISNPSSPFATKFMLEKKCFAWSHDSIFFSLFPFSRPLLPPTPLLWMPQTSQRCGLCRRRCSYCCNLCHEVYYCNKEHQREHWLLSHRIQCIGRKGMLTRDHHQTIAPPSTVTKNDDGDWVFV